MWLSLQCTLVLGIFIKNTSSCQKVFYIRYTIQGHPSPLWLEKRNYKQISQKNSIIGISPSVKTKRDTAAETGVNHLNNLLKLWDCLLEMMKQMTPSAIKNLACVQVHATSHKLLYSFVWSAELTWGHAHHIMMHTAAKAEACILKINK